MLGAVTQIKYSKMSRLTREAVSLDINRFEQNSKLGDSPRALGDNIDNDSTLISDQEEKVSRREYEPVSEAS